MAYKYWTSEDDAKLEAHPDWPCTDPRWATVLPGRSKNAINGRRKLKNLPRPGIPMWNKRDKIVVIVAQKKGLSPGQTAKLLGRSKAAVKDMRQRLGAVRHHQNWTGNEIRDLRRMRAAGMSVSEAANRFPRHSRHAVICAAARLAPAADPRAWKVGELDALFSLWKLHTPHDPFWHTVLPGRSPRSIEAKAHACGLYWRDLRRGEQGKHGPRNQKTGAQAGLHIAPQWLLELDKEAV